MTRAPLRFLLTVMALWVGVRAAILLPGGPGESAARAAAATTGPAGASYPRLVAAAAVAWPRRNLRIAEPQPVFSPALRSRIPDPPSVLPASTFQLAAGMPRWTMPKAMRSASPRLPALAAPSVPRGPGRWSLSAWVLVRDDGGSLALAPGGTLGGSQAGARLTYGIGGGVSLSGRAYLPLRQRSGAELAPGIDWQPMRSLPLHLLAERRQRLGREGRNAFALTLYGGASRALTPRVRLDAYGQAGVVGLQHRDLFADGALRVARRIGPIELGAGLWGAAQPGARRLDAGPSLSWRLPVRAANLRLQADWRVRVAGEAAPGSGPSLTLAADF
jgi:hypothetical protein